MKRFRLLALILCLCISVNCFAFAVLAAPEDAEDKKDATEKTNESDSPNLSAPSSILVNMDSGEVLYEHNANEKKYPASTTKIMTALLAIEKLDMKKTSKVSNNAVMSIAYDSSKLGLYEGEEINNYDLVCAMLVASGNDAANVIAESVAGSVDKFVQMMNNEAKSLGCTGTHFTNTHGLTEEEHYTTAADMAKIAKKAMENSVFREMVKTTYYELPKTDKCDVDRIFYTTNNMLTKVRTPNYLYEAATGIKTGYTSAALNCLVASAEKEGVKLISVVLNASNIDGVNTAYSDTKALFDWGFKNYKSKTVVTAGTVIDERSVKYAKRTKTVKLVAKNDYNAVMKSDADETLVTTEIKLDEKLSAPLFADETVGTMDVLYGGEIIGTVELTPDKEYEYSWWAAFRSALGRIVGIFVLIIIVALVALIIIRQVEYEKRKKARRASRGRA